MGTEKQMNWCLCMTDVALLTLSGGELCVLLTKRKSQPHQGKWGLPGVMVNPEIDENVESAALRALSSKAKVTQAYVEQLEAFSGWDRDPRGFSISYAHLCAACEKDLDLPKDADVRLVPVDEALGMDLAFDHEKILQSAVLRLRNKVSYSSLPAHLLPEKFTLGELQSAYETLLSTKLDKSAFRKKMSELDFLEECSGEMKRGSNRPAQLYTINRGKPLALLRRTLAP